MAAKEEKAALSSIREKYVTVFNQQIVEPALRDLQVAREKLAGGGAYAESTAQRGAAGQTQKIDRAIEALTRLRERSTDAGVGHLEAALRGL